MMFAPRCFSRVTLVLLSVILGLLLFTALRVHNGIPPTVSITAAQSMVENLAGEWFHLDRQHPDKVSPFTPQADNGAEEPKPPEILEGKASRNLARPPELEYLRQQKFGLTDTILYHLTCIRPIFDTTINRNLITNITQPLISDEEATIRINLKQDDLIGPFCSNFPLLVPPPYPKTKHPELIFGVASTYSRLSNPATLFAFAHWLSGSKSRLILTITDYHSLPPSSTLPALVKLYSNHSILTTALPPPSPPPNFKNYTTPQLHFLLLSSMLSFSTPQTTFLSLLDDDTFFPSLHTLSLSLSRYNPSLPLYLGAKSDSKSANAQYGEMAFGGAGIFVSVPLAKQLAPYQERCATEADKELGGDGILKDCVYNFTETRLTELEGLWQGDVRGDVSGVFEAGGRVGSGSNGGRGKWKRDRGGGASGDRGTGNFNGRWTTSDNDNNNNTNNEDRGLIPRRTLQRLPNRIWVSITGFIDRITGTAKLNVTLENKTDTPVCADYQNIPPPQTHGTTRHNPSKPPPHSPDLHRRRGKQPSPPPLLSLHHWKTWFHAPVAQMAAVNQICGDCFLQRFITGHLPPNTTTTTTTNKTRQGLWVNGYSYTEYPPNSFPTDQDLSKVEATWLYADEGDYDDAYGPMRPKMAQDQKKQWLLADAYWAGTQKSGRRGGQKKQFRQVYIYRAPRILPGQEKENKNAVDEVLEVVWEL